MDDTVIFVICAIIAGIIYFVPTIIATRRDHSNMVAIFLLNLLLGWSFLGWLAALIWSVSRTNPKDKAPAPTKAEAVVRCPYCAENIQALAIKCKHCGSNLSRTPQNQPGEANG